MEANVRAAVNLQIGSNHTHPHWANEGLVIFCELTSLPRLSVWWEERRERFVEEARSAPRWILLDFMSREFPLLQLYCVFYSISSQPAHTVFVNIFKFFTLLFVKMLKRKRDKKRCWLRLKCKWVSYFARQWYGRRYERSYLGSF